MYYFDVLDLHVYFKILQCIFILLNLPFTCRQVANLYLYL